MTNTLSINDLYLTLAGKSILRGIELSVLDGQMMALIGPNGSGKTSLLHCIGGLITSYSGAIKLGQQNLSTLKQSEIAKQLAYLHQHMPANLNLSIQQVVELGLIPHLSPWGSITREQQYTVVQAITDVGLEHLIDRPFISLSGGEKQRVLIAKTIVQNPSYLLMDEPTNHLDIKHQMAILSLVKSLRLTTIACIHDINLALATCDYIVCLNDGDIVFAKLTSAVSADDFAKVYGVDCLIDEEPYLGRKRLNVRWQA